MFIPVVNECNIGIRTPIFMFHHDPGIEVVYVIIRTHPENAVFDRDTRRRYECRVSRKREITRNFSLSGRYYVFTRGCEIDGRFFEIPVETHHGNVFIHGI